MLNRDFLSLQLQAFKEKNHTDQLQLAHFTAENPFERAKKEIQKQLEIDDAYRASILKNVTTFGGLSMQAILSAARSMDEIFYEKGDVIIEQDDIGDSFFILEEGLVAVSRRMNARDPDEVPRELARLGKNAHFGEIALLTADPRSASITVLSETAKCLRMTKNKFDELLSTTNKIQAENRKQIGKDVLDAVPLFKQLSVMNKKKLLDAMVPMQYMPGSYICRQGTAGNTFYIITEGLCKVTINNSSDHDEREVAKLHPGDFFGEVALIENSNRRTANVISSDTVSCLTLSRNDFNSLLKNVKTKIMEHQAIRNGVTSGAEAENETAHAMQDMRQHNALSRKRRISGFNTHGQRDEARIGSLLKRFGRFMTESLWNSLYGRMYRDMLLDSNKAIEFGKFATFVMRSNDNRFDASKAIEEQAVRILEMDCNRRTPAEHSFVVGLLRQRNQLKEKLCKNWPIHQYTMLCKKTKMIRVRAFRKVIEADTRGTTAFMILRGCVRVYTKVHGGQGKNTYYEEDLCPGDIFGETALSGMHSRMMTVMAITNVDLLVIDDQDFMMAQDRDSMHMGTEERAKYLSKVPMFRNWDSYKLLRLAHVLVQEEIEKKTLLIQHGQVNRDLYFIVQGRVDILDHLEKRHIITSLTTNDFLGESGFCNRFTKAVNRKVKEEFYAVAVTKLDVLVLHDANFALFDVQSIDLMKTAFLAKLEWRRSRVKTMKVERAKVRKKYFLMHAEADRMLTSGASSNPTTTTVTIHRNDSPPRTMQTNETEYVEQVLQRRGDEDVDYEYRDYYEFFDSNGEVQEAQSPKPSSGLPSVPQSPFRSSFPVKQENPRNETARISATDTAYHSALVHPLDDRLNNPNQWIGIGTVEEQKTKSLKFVQEIPTIMAKDFDLLMVSASLKNHKQFTKIQDLVFHGKKTVSPKRQQAQHQMTLSRRTNSSPFASRINSKNNSRNNSRPASATASRPASAMKRFEQPKLEMPSLEESIPQFFVQTLHKHEVSNEQNDYSHVAPGRIRPSSANARINVVEDNQTKPPAIHKGSTIVKIPSHQHLSSSQHRPLSASAAPMRLPPHQQRIYDDQQNRAALKVLEEAQNKHKSQLLEMSHESKHDPSHSADEGLESSQVIMNTQSHSVRLSLSNIDDELGDSLHGEESNALPISRRPRSAVIRSVKGSPAAGPLINARKR